MQTEKKYLENLYNDIQIEIEEIMKEPTQEHLEDLRQMLNKFFPDSECLSVLYTPNVDKLFFGVYAFPKVTGDDIVNIFFKGERFRVTQYWLELDSRMFTGELMLTAGEITALIIHDVAHLVNNSAPASIVKKEIDRYLVKNNDILKVSDSVHYRGILAYGFADALRKYTTIFEEDHYVPNSITDEFIDWIDFNALIRSAFNKLNVMWCNYNREVRNKFITLSWVLRIYQNLRPNRIPALEAIKTCIILSPSTIEKRELKNMGARISRIDDDQLLESADPSDQRLLDLIRNNYTDRPRHTYSHFSLIECFQDDIDNLVLGKEEYNEPNGLKDMLHCMNKKMSYIQDYVENDGDLDPTEFKQWNEMFKNLDRMRKDISNGRLYNEGKTLINTYTRYGDQ